MAYGGWKKDGGFANGGWRMLGFELALDSVESRMVIKEVIAGPALGCCT